MSNHIAAQADQIAQSILLPGDPLRAKFIAESLLEDAFCFNKVRGMLGYTGTYQGKRVSVMGTGMGMPSHAIYVTELLQDYGVQTLVRVGTCVAFQAELKIGDIVLAMTASTNSHINRLRFDGCDFAPAADFELLLAAYQAAQAKGIPVRVGGILSNDTFYDDDPQAWHKWRDYGVLAVEMEANALYTLAAKFHARALAILTVSDSLVNLNCSQRRGPVFCKCELRCSGA